MVTCAMGREMGARLIAAAQHAEIDERKDDGPGDSYGEEWHSSGGE